MANNFTFPCPVTNGLHARPASQLADVAKKFVPDIWLVNERSNVRVNAKSVLAIVSADIRHGDSCRIETDGGLGAGAIEEIIAFVRDVLPGLGELPASVGGEGACVPRSLIQTEASWEEGRPVSSGIGRGVVVKAGLPEFPDQLGEPAGGSQQEELSLLRGALARVRAHISERRDASAGEVRSEVLAAHLAIAEDVDLRHAMEEEISRGCSAVQSVVQAVRFFADRLRASETEYIRQRAVDVEDVGLQALELLCGTPLTEAKIELAEPSVVVASDLSPRQLLGMDRGYVAALILENGARTSHVVILARSLGIPMLVGAENALSAFDVGETVIVDANIGVAVRSPGPEVERYFDREKEIRRRRRGFLEKIAERDAITRDGRRVEVALNVNCTADLDSRNGRFADGIGLLRTELIFTDREEAPTEEQQYELYSRAATSVSGGQVIIRMFDVGADKPLPFFRLPAESNPFLGCRGVRNYERHWPLIHDQIRAIVRASADGPICLMIPMVTRVEEVSWIRAKVADVQEELRRDNVPFNPQMPVGIMVEVPLICYAIEDLCRIVDFFSIGTNDLSQYFSAADRCNKAVAGLARVRHPAFLRVLDSVVKAAHAHDRQVYMCGNMAAEVRNIPLLVGLQLDEISAVSSEIPKLKATIGNQWADRCSVLYEEAKSLRTVVEVERLLDRALCAQGTDDLLAPELVVVDVDCTDKTTAIKLLIDEMFVAGRTDHPHKLEEAVWRREEESATGLGHGFAIPHCKSEAVGISTVAVARLRKPIEWESVDDKPVECVVLLAMSEADQQNTHMKVFSTLARRLMHEEFRAGLLGADGAAALYEFLRSEVAFKLNSGPAS